MPDGRVKIELTYRQIGMIFGALNVVQSKINGAQNTLVQMELRELRDEMTEQIQEQVDKESDNDEP